MFHPARSLSTTWLLAGLFLLAAGVSAQSKADLLRAAYARKKSQAFFKRGGFTEDYDAARQRAKKEKKLIFAYFTRSYQECRSSETVEATFLTDPAFHAATKDLVLFCHVTTGIPGRQGDGLFVTMGFDTYPTLAFLNADGGVLSTRIPPALPGFRKALGAATEYLKLEAKARTSDDPALAARAFMAYLRLGTFDIAAAKKRLAGLKVADAVRKETDGYILNAEFNTWARTLSRDRDALARKAYAEYRRGRRIPIGVEWEARYVDMVMLWAERQLDLPTFEATFERVYKIAEQRWAREVKVMEEGGSGRTKVMRDRHLRHLRGRLEKLRKRVGGG